MGTSYIVLTLRRNDVTHSKHVFKTYSSSPLFLLKQSGDSNKQLLLKVFIRLRGREITSSTNICPYYPSREQLTLLTLEVTEKGRERERGRLQGIGTERWRKLIISLTSVSLPLLSFYFRTVSCTFLSKQDMQCPDSTWHMGKINVFFICLYFICFPFRPFLICMVCRVPHPVMHI